MAPEFSEVYLQKGANRDKQDELGKLLGKAGGRLEELRSELYPTLRNLAGKTKDMSAPDIVAGLADAIRTYEAPESIDKDTPAGSANWLWDNGEKFIDAIVPDKQKAAEAKFLWNEILLQSSDKTKE